LREADGAVWLADLHTMAQIDARDRLGEAVAGGPAASSNVGSRVVEDPAPEAEEAAAAG